MPRRISYDKVAPGAMHAMLGLERYVRESGLEHSLLHLVKMRASQINGCAYCLDMHSKDARADGETEQRLYVLNAWREAPFYTPRERAALAWTEAVTRIGDGVSDELLASVREHFNEKELADLTMAIVAINGWNRLAISLGADVGSYQPAARRTAPADRAESRSERAPEHAEAR
ncbi:MAG TPA: carboxymuconolactone decarboxylase family protein [Gemmatimonadaceae bacterium]|nr:carboxymuconolactone decarboxylase family protein [Gemmatimonadaceae bacterium]